MTARRASNRRASNRRASNRRASNRRGPSGRTGALQPVLLAVGVVLVLLGLLWTGQGIGWVGGSVMTGVTFWAVVGPLVALVGLALCWRGVRRRG